MEHKITCPVCGDTQRCFEEQQEHFSSFMCFNCGFMSDTRYKQGSLELVHNKKLRAALIQDLQFEDTGRGIVWFPCVINMGTKGIIFPEGVKEEYVWKYAKVVEIPEDEREKYDNYDRRLDVENAETYEKFEFLEACKSMGITQDL